VLSLLPPPSANTYRIVLVWRLLKPVSRYEYGNFEASPRCGPQRLAKEQLPHRNVPPPQLQRFQIPAAGNFDNSTLLKIALADMVALVWLHKPLCYGCNNSPESLAGSPESAWMLMCSSCCCSGGGSVRTHNVSIHTQLPLSTSAKQPIYTIWRDGKPS